MLVRVELSPAVESTPDSRAVQVSNNPFMLIFGAFQIVLSQVPNLNELWLVSMVAAIMAFAYSLIGFGLAIGKTSGMLAALSFGCAAPSLHGGTCV